MARQASAHDGMLEGGVVVEDCADDLAGADLALDGDEEAEELVVAMALHVAADHGPVKHVHCREQGGRVVPFVFVGHGPEAALFLWQSGLGAVEQLDFALLVDAEGDGVGPRIDVEADGVARLVDELVRVLGEFEPSDAILLEPVSTPDALNRAGAAPPASAIAAPAQCVASPGASIVSSSIRSAIELSFGMREGRVLSRRSRPKPPVRNRSCSARRRPWICWSRA